MTSCYHRLTTAPITAQNGAVQSRPRTVEILSLPLNRNYANQRPGIFLRSSKHSKSFIFEAVGPNGVWDRFDGGNEAEKVGPCPYSAGDHQAVGDVVEKDENRDRKVEINGKRTMRRRTSSSRSKDRTVKVVVAAAITVVLGVGNRVLYKLALVPLKHYPFFLAQLATFGYLALLLLLFFLLD